MCWGLPLFRISKIATILKTGSYRCNVWRKKRVIPLWYLPAVGVAPFYFFPLFVRCSFFLCLIKTLLFFLCGRVFYTWVKLGCFLVLRSCFVFFALPKPCHFFPWFFCASFLACFFPCLLLGCVLLHGRCTRLYNAVCVVSFSPVFNVV